MKTEINNITVLRCFRCKKLLGDIPKEELRVVQGYQQHSCRADIDYFFLNLTEMKFQKSMPVNLEQAVKLAKMLWK